MKTPLKAPWFSDRGFTMVEVLVVIAILGILAATTVPAYLKQRPQRLLSSTTNLIVSNFNDARVKAIRDNENYYMEFLPEVDTVRIWDQRSWSVYAIQRHFEPGTIIGPYSMMPKVLSPTLNVRIYSQGPMLYRNLGTTRAIASDRVIPSEVDIRMDPNFCINQNYSVPPLIARPLSPNVANRSKLLSRGPLLFLTFRPDGSVVNSWSYPCEDPREYIEPPVGRHLGVTEIFLQVRGNENPVTTNNFIPNIELIERGIFPNQSLPTMYYEDGTPRFIGHGSAETEIKFEAMNPSNGRRIVINNATGRIMVENWAPYNIDIPPIDLDGDGELSPDEIFRPDDPAYPNRKHWL